MSTDRSKEDEQFSILKFFDARNAKESYARFQQVKKATKLALHTAYSGPISTVRAFGRYNRRGRSVGLMMRLKLHPRRVFARITRAGKAGLVYPGE